MLIRLGYVAMTLNLADASPSGTITVASYNKLPSEEAKMNKLRRIAAQNLKNTYRILLYSKAYNISVYRFTSKLIPLATHPVIDGWDYAGELKAEFKQIGDFVKQNDFRVSAHPDHYTLINSPSERVLEEAVKDLYYHAGIYEAMGLEDYRYKLVMHVGGLYKDKQSSIERFKENFMKLPERIRKRIILENDDKSYTAADVLGICNTLKIPMVLDVHHHKCANNGESLQDMLGDIFNTWNNEYFKPKIHFSSPKNEKNFRSHADDIELGEFAEFLNIARGLDRDFDVMLEAKNKDSALLKLSDGLKQLPGIERVNEGELIIN